MTKVLEAKNLTRYYKVLRGAFREPSILKAVDGVSFNLTRGQTLAVVGESGCGKSTLARLIAMVEPPTAGSLQIANMNVVGADSGTLRSLRPKVQMVFQNPYGSLNPRQTIGSILEEPLLVNTSTGKAERMEKVRAMMSQVGLRQEHYERYPHMFSGGQRQRIAIARALMLEPDILLLDEPVSALDISIQAQVLNLLGDLQEKFNLAYVFISHDLSVVQHIANSVMVMYLGRVVEHSESRTLFSSPQHPYTKALLSATPTPDPLRRKERTVLKGELPSPLNPPSGCTFHPRCPIAFDICPRENPLPKRRANGYAACHALDAPSQPISGSRQL